MADRSPWLNVCLGDVHKRMTADKTKIAALARAVKTARVPKYIRDYMDKALSSLEHAAAFQEPGQEVCLDSEDYADAPCVELASLYETLNDVIGRETLGTLERLVLAIEGGYDRPLDDLNRAVYDAYDVHGLLCMCGRSATPAVRAAFDACFVHG